MLSPTRRRLGAIRPPPRKAAFERALALIKQTPGDARELPIRRGLAICHWMQGHLGETSGLAIVDRGLAKKTTGWDRMTEPPSSKNKMADRRVLEIMPIWRGTGSSNPYRSSGERSRASKQTGCRRSAAQCRDPTAGLRAVPSSAG